MGLNGLCLPISVAVAKHVGAEAQHQAFRRLILSFMRRAQRDAMEWDEKDTLHRMEGSLQDGRRVWEEVAMFVVELFKDKVTVNVIMGATTLEALTVTSFAGERGQLLQALRRACIVI